MNKNGQKIDLSEGDSNLSPARKKWRDRIIDEQTREWLALDEKYFMRQSLRVSEGVVECGPS